MLSVLLIIQNFGFYSTQSDAEFTGMMLWVKRGKLVRRWRQRFVSIVEHRFFGEVLCLFKYDNNVVDVRHTITPFSPRLVDPTRLRKSNVLSMVSLAISGYEFEAHCTKEY